MSLPQRSNSRTDSRSGPDYCLKQRGAIWWFQKTVPAHLRHVFGPLVQETLGTSDKREARRLRDLRLAEWHVRFSEADQEPETRPIRKLALIDPDRAGSEAIKQLEAQVVWLSQQDRALSEAEKEGCRVLVEDLVGDSLRPVWNRLKVSDQRIIRTLSKAVMDAASDLAGTDLSAVLQPTSARTQKPQRKSLGDLAEEFLTSKERAGLPDKTLKQYRHYITALKESEWDGNELLDELRASGKSPTTVYNYFNNLRTFARWLGKRGVNLDLPEVSKRTMGHSSTRDIFTADELKKIALHPMDPTAKWVCLIAIHHGFRMQDILQLEYHDIRERHGYWCFEIHDRGEKSAKTAPTVRTVPIHSWLLKHGLLDYWKEHKGWARHWKSYDGTSTQGFSKFVNPVIRNALGIETSQTPTGKKVFHSFRHTFRDACREAGMDEATIDMLGGWSRGKGGEGQKYGKGRGVAFTHELLAKVTFFSDRMNLAK